MELSCSGMKIELCHEQKKLTPSVFLTVSWVTRGYFACHVCRTRGAGSLERVRKPNCLHAATASSPRLARIDGYVAIVAHPRQAEDSRERPPGGSRRRTTGPEEDRQPGPQDVSQSRSMTSPSGSAARRRGNEFGKPEPNCRTELRTVLLFPTASKMKTWRR